MVDAVHNRPTEMIMLVFLFVLNSNVATKVANIIKVEYAFVVNVEILDLTIIEMIVKRYLLQILFRVLIQVPIIVGCTTVVIVEIFVCQ